MLGNFRGQLGVLLRKVRSGLTSLQISAARGAPEELPELVDGEHAEEVPKLEGFSGE